ncbi:MAG: hypothetical protein Q7S27_05360 [Nanoarchaeota archaeon]|nr:hypothetical protein [Nanoarchaeota archaeon]
MKHKKNQTKAMVLSIAVIIGIAIIANLASAESWACFGKSQKIDFCNPKTPDRTCANSNCMYCIEDYNEIDKCYNQGNFNTCNSIAPECTVFGDGSNIDSEPPVLNIINPTKGGIYRERSILLKFTTNEKSDVSFINNADPRRSTRICQDCLTHEKKRSFKEGFNNITFIAEDVVGNAVSKIVSFFIDSQVPRITKTFPKKGFASGIFQIEVKEDNPQTIMLNYGNGNEGFRTSNLNIPSQCSTNKGKYKCNATVDLSQFNNKTITYWFEIKDIASNIAISKPLPLMVDTQAPLIDSFNYELHENHLMFEIKVTEENFESIEYRDNSVLRPAWKTMCSRLDKSAVCKKQLTFKAGSHDIDIMVSDEAGNSISRNVDISI